MRAYKVFERIFVGGAEDEDGSVVLVGEALGEGGKGGGGPAFHDVVFEEGRTGMKSDERAGGGDVGAEPVVSFVVIGGGKMHDEGAGITGAGHAKELEEVEVLFDYVARFVFPDPMTLDEIEIRDVEVIIAMTNRAGAKEGLDEIVFPTVGWQGDDGGVVAAGTDAQDIAQGAQG